MQPPLAPPDMPPFPVKACFLGKAFSGKSTAAQQMAKGKISFLNYYI